HNNHGPAPNIKLDLDQAPSLLLLPLSRRAPVCPLRDAAIPSSPPISSFLPADEMAEIEIKTAPADFRFPTTNQTRHCFTRYVEFHRCVSAKGDEAAECEKFAKYYRSLCPAEWVEKWNEQRENGTFAGPL
uniref:Cytochrome c oxidase subunit n=3 Tax=Aegilops tauschii subsp. strangulata TaxID=200361 RepID=A0A453CBH2_AEGTS